jgi:hypothetical protein
MDYIPALPINYFLPAQGFALGIFVCCCMPETQCDMATCVCIWCITLHEWHAITMLALQTSQAGAHDSSLRSILDQYGS